MGLCKIFINVVFIRSSEIDPDGGASMPLLSGVMCDFKQGLILKMMRELWNLVRLNFC